MKSTHKIPAIVLVAALVILFANQKAQAQIEEENHEQFLNQFEGSNRLNSSFENWNREKEPEQEYKRGESNNSFKFFDEGEDQSRYYKKKKEEPGANDQSPRSMGGGDGSIQILKKDENTGSGASGSDAYMMTNTDKSKGNNKVPKDHGEPPPAVPDNGGEPPDTPIDGGVLILAAAGLYAGARKIYRQRKVCTL